MLCNRLVPRVGRKGDKYTYLTAWKHLDAEIKANIQKGVRKIFPDLKHFEAFWPLEAAAQYHIMVKNGNDKKHNRLPLATAEEFAQFNPATPSPRGITTLLT